MNGIGRVDCYLFYYCSVFDFCCSPYRWQQIAGHEQKQIISYLIILCACLLWLKVFNIEKTNNMDCLIHHQFNLLFTGNPIPLTFQFLKKYIRHQQLGLIMLKDERWSYIHIHGSWTPFGELWVWYTILFVCVCLCGWVTWETSITLSKYSLSMSCQRFGHSRWLSNRRVTKQPSFATRQFWIIYRKLFWDFSDLVESVKTIFIF